MNNEELLNNLMTAVVEKHGTLVLGVDKTGRFTLYRKNDPERLTFYAFSIGSVLIRMLAKEKI